MNQHAAGRQLLSRSVDHEFRVQESENFTA